MCNSAFGVLSSVDKNSINDKMKLNAFDYDCSKSNFNCTPCRRACPDEQHAEELITTPTCIATECSVKQIFHDVRVYTAEEIEVRTLDEEAYQYHLFRGELDAAPPWAKTFARGFRGNHD